jgi:hypothetical protein
MPSREYAKLTKTFPLSATRSEPPALCAPSR